MVPNSAAGAIIGKGGAHLKEMEKEFRNAKLRISGPNILYPSTQDRIIIINGSVEDITEINKSIQDKVSTIFSAPPFTQFPFLFLKTRNGVLKK